VSTGGRNVNAKGLEGNICEHGVKGQCRSLEGAVYEHGEG
jgi:hypothetical protein